MKIHLDKQSYFYFALSCMGFMFAVGIEHFAHTGEVSHIPNYICGILSSVFVVKSLMSVKKTENMEVFKKTVNKVLLFTLLYGTLGSLAKVFFGGIAVFVVGFPLFLAVIKEQDEEIKSSI